MSRVSRAFYFASYLTFRFYEGLIRLLPLDGAFILGRLGGKLAYRILRSRRALALANLRLAFGATMSETELRALNRAHFQLLGANLLAGLKAYTLPDEKIWERVSLKLPVERPQTGSIALISHTGNWELYSHFGRKFPERRFGAVYQSLANPFVDRYLRATRTKSGIRLFDRREQLLSCARFLREGGVVGVLVDQGAGYAGLWTPLFGRLTSSSTLAARLSIRTGCPVLPVTMNTRGRARWNMTISEPVYPKSDGAELFTARINRLLEEQIRSSPADWLWAHNRWKPLRPHFLFARDQRRVFFPPNFDRSTLDPFKILIISPDSIEHAEDTFAAVDAIKVGRPDNALTVLTLKRLGDIWNRNPAVDRVLESNGNESIFALASTIRTGQFDAAIFFATNWKTVVAVRLAGIPLRVARRSSVTTWLCNQHPAEPEQPYDSRRVNLHIAQSVGADINSALIEMNLGRPGLQTI